MSLRFFAYAALTVLVAFLLLFFSKPIAIWIVESISPAPKSKGAPVGQISEVVGNVYIRQSHATHTKPVEDDLPLELYQHDALLVGTGSLARLIFSGGAEINLLEDSEILVEFFNAKDAMSPVYVTLRRGDLEIKKAGLPGRLFIVKDKRVLSLPEWETGKDIPSNLVNVAPEEQAVKVESDAGGKPEPKEAVKASGESAESTAPVVKMGNEQTLSSAYIEKTLAEKSGHFRRCQSNAIRDKLPAFGQMLYSIRIDPNGKIGNVRQLSSSVNNIHLTSCITEVIERTTFRAFNGKAITISYPIDFQ